MELRGLLVMGIAVVKWWEDDNDAFIRCRHKVSQNADWIGIERWVVMK